MDRFFFVELPDSIGDDAIEIKVVGSKVIPTSNVDQLKSIVFSVMSA